ncbi:MAG: 50S ribosome-binding GTPase [Candidatus Nanoarchaeia archaeon]|nr:50S ribosome-binding GTPase [Candidatus Nanoarchaeia archaeon]MDD5053961.1 50S ribosome-binding GTPase [Candidatus Nanoarchaeia archaeon]MDD5500003.1 50S ribosome-binding GTPase [Candidatus Nanoarchaeia archaeon]
MNIPSVGSHSFYFDTAYNSAKKVVLQGKLSFMDKKRITTIVKAKKFYESLYSQLTAIITHFPDVDKTSKFYQELIESALSIDEYKKSLGAINWSRSMVKKLYFSFKKKEISLQELFGRSKSVLKQVSKDLEFLKKARTHFASFPSIKNLKTALLAGFPNVGKTSILAELTDSKPEINSYPFTTKKINIGIMKMNSQKIQIIDTPGLLERPIEKMNKIEMKAIIALKHLADLILFIFDSSGMSGFETSEQKKLYESIKKLFPDKKIFTITNKCEEDKSIKTDFYVSCKTKEGISILKTGIFTHFFP